MANSAQIGGRNASGTSAKGTQERPRVVLADDHLDVLDEIRHLLVPEFDLVRAVKDGAALIEAAAELRPDAVISDIRMTGLSGIEAGRQILQRGLCKAVVVLTMYNEPHLVSRAFQAGIRGYVLKVDAGEELIPAVYTVLSGCNYLSRGVSASRGSSGGGGLSDPAP